MWSQNLKMFRQILPRYSQSIKRVIDTRSVLRAEKKDHKENCIPLWSSCQCYTQISPKK